uniref:Uncharacterized protein n=1 Tax=Chromera velia CCMP2878 TaxID=1169474 RepID=A0A0G4HTU8_9ALVE|eukprot:Cvel_1347.t1-p1 / transcript=Cvel_1347.t1 / gene=Cvel_1347 / organism=Chromera_velia_CCMP2878 / gene_product=hypothetical protein / transcript_product=hypothetical protein / location=Cvel_scaffold46:74320-74817(-) / protein_length=166 / sequence_SO=supercontig / SO=protein_coding / is_pseudo=false
MRVREHVEAFKWGKTYLQTSSRGYGFSRQTDTAGQRSHPIHGIPSALLLATGASSTPWVYQVGQMPPPYSASRFSPAALQPPMGETGPIRQPCPSGRQAELSHALPSREFLRTLNGRRGNDGRPRAGTLRCFFLEARLDFVAESASFGSAGSWSIGSWCILLDHLW